MVLPSFTGFYRILLGIYRVSHQNKVRDAEVGDENSVKGGSFTEFILFFFGVSFLFFPSLPPKKNSTTGYKTKKKRRPTRVAMRSADVLFHFFLFYFRCFFVV